MPVDPWAETVAQEFPTQEPDTFRHLAQTIAGQKREMFDLRASVLANVSDIVADLQAKQATLEAQQAALTDQQAALEAQQAALTTADAGSASSGTVTVTTTTGAFATILFYVPAGYTRAAVVANSAISFSSATGGLGVEMTTRINGVGGVTMYQYVDTATGLGNGSTNHSRVFAVSPGGSFTVDTTASGGGASADALISTSAAVTYFRS